jgi:hypothetical protein
MRCQLILPKLCIIGIFLLMPRSAYAHRSSNAFLYVNARADGIDAVLDIAIRDLAAAVAIDKNGDNQITWGEVKGAEQDVLELLQEGLFFFEDNHSCRKSPITLAMTKRSDGAYLRSSLKFSCPVKEIKSVEIEYSLLFALDADHRALMEFADQSGQEVFVFTSGARHFSNEFKGERQKDTRQKRGFSHFFTEGVLHIFGGFDHILFLFTLLFQISRRFVTSEKISDRHATKSRYISLAKVVTAFTIAHSLTLALVALRIWSDPPASRYVESAIAATVALSAVNYFWRFLRGPDWIYAFVFGLIHGMGLASVLLDLGLSGLEIAKALLWFNLGIELGQIGIVLFFVALMHLIERTKFYEMFCKGASMLILCVSVLWFIERAFDVAFLPF